MIRLLLFFKKIYLVLFFVALEVVCLSVLFSKNPYQRAQSLRATNYLIGGLHDRISGVGEYFSLAERNEKLMAENALLMERLYQLGLTDTMSGHSNELLNGSMPVHVVHVVRKTTNMRDNFITISSGTKQGIEPDMALYNSEGIVGYVLDCSDNFSICISVLNYSGFRSSGKIKGTDFTGLLSWNGLNSKVLDIKELPAHSGISVGDTILTTLYSNIFPEDLPVGIVISSEMINGTYYNGKVMLFADMSSLDYLYAVKLPLQDERNELETKVKQTE